MNTTTTTTATLPAPGSPVRVRLIGGSVLSGALLRADERVLRLRAATGGGLMVISRRAATLLEAA
ncbi:MAG: hypothetical protein U0531_17155 [Dehalococcoidia bacterium]